MGKVPHEDDDLPTDDADQRRDDTLRAMLRTKPKPHQAMKIGRTKGGKTAKGAESEGKD